MRKKHVYWAFIILFLTALKFVEQEGAQETFAFQQNFDLNDHQHSEDFLILPKAESLNNESFTSGGTVYLETGIVSTFSPFTHSPIFKEGNENVDVSNGNTKDKYFETVDDGFNENGNSHQDNLIAQQATIGLPQINVKAKQGGNHWKTKTSISTTALFQNQQHSTQGDALQGVPTYPHQPVPLDSRAFLAILPICIAVAFFRLNKSYNFNNEKI